MYKFSYFIYMKNLLICAVVVKRELLFETQVRLLSLSGLAFHTSIFRRVFPD